MLTKLNSKQSLIIFSREIFNILKVLRCDVESWEDFDDSFDHDEASDEEVNGDQSVT